MVSSTARYYMFFKKDFRKCLEKAILAADVNGLRKEQKSVKLMFCSGSHF
jgi:hypothetical protein